MQYFDPDAGAPLKDAFDDLVLGWDAVTTKTMFGCPSYLADETLFAVLVTDGIALTSLPTEMRDSIPESFEPGPFQAGDRTVSKWVQVTATDPSDIETLRPFIEASYEQANSD